jgi:hypothetical protein
MDLPAFLPKEPNMGGRLQGKVALITGWGRKVGYLASDEPCRVTGAGPEIGGGFIAL